MLSRHPYICAVSSGKIVGSSGSSTYVSNGPGRVQSINVGNGGSSAYSSSGACPTHRIYIWLVLHSSLLLPKLEDACSFLSASSSIEILVNLVSYILQPISSFMHAH